MPEGYFLSESDLRILKALIAKEKNTVRRTRNRVEDDEPDIQSPDVYIALPPVSGIPALTRPGSGSDQPVSFADSPGVAKCTIYQLIEGDTPSFEQTSITQNVYNLSTGEVGHDWTLVVRDKFGRYLVPSVASSSNAFIKRGKLISSLSIGSRHILTSALFEPWEFDGTQWTQTDTSIVVYDDGMVPASSALSAGTWLQIVKIADSWFYDGHNCDPSTGTGS